MIYGNGQPEISSAGGLIDRLEEIKVEEVMT
jgi:hypothetical protein